MGGISIGEERVVRIAVKPTPTVSVEQPSINMVTMTEEKLSPITRRDATICGRIYPVAEAMIAAAILDALYLARAYDALAKLDDKWMKLKAPRKSS